MVTKNLKIIPFMVLKCITLYSMIAKFTTSCYFWEVLYSIYSPDSRKDAIHFSWIAIYVHNKAILLLYNKQRVLIYHLLNWYPNLLQLMIPPLS